MGGLRWRCGVVGVVVLEPGGQGRRSVRVVGHDGLDASDAQAGEVLDSSLEERGGGGCSFVGMDE